MGHQCLNLVENRLSQSNWKTVDAPLDGASKGITFLLDLLDGLVHADSCSLMGASNVGHEIHISFWLLLVNHFLMGLCEFVVTSLLKQ